MAPRAVNAAAPLPAGELVGHNYDGFVFAPFMDRYYGGSDFVNWGYWLSSTSTQKEACDNLMEMLLAFVPEKSGRILDVACGKGATTRYLLRHYSHSDVVGINTSEVQLRRARVNAPGCALYLMDATALAFPDGWFDTVICVEAAFHFDSREGFLREAWRVLRPHGHLVLSDILFARPVHEVVQVVNRHNFVSDPAAYAELLWRVGFVDVKVVDASAECWLSFERHHAQYVRREVRLGLVRPLTASRVEARRRRRLLATRFYVLAAATKP
jgi:SAM-dependent methyltransferase